MSFQKFWREYKVLIVMVPLIGFIHVGWHRIRSSPVFQVPSKDSVPEADSLTLSSPPKSHIQGK
ncbi:uncharacterized LOC128706665 homolog [Sorex fumeus]|uniref:uncharacterized LOC128706665 homolog n=1 Tax=Sorex fumeus TaxID=62283 RepID=UPI0024ACBD9A|nr:uncharacterized LOC128706665 homolog [Sorex fumeus]XP_055977883.1 uncharacterized LOC128706665 homolog [Sorex fumeus]